MKSGSRVRAGAALLLALALCNPAQAGKEKALYGFAGGGDGAFPQGNVILDAQGNIYGTAQSGGGSGCGGGGCGIVFRLTPRGKETILHVFTADGDGAFPIAGPVMDQAGNLYGTTLNGGGARCQCGTVFRIAPDGTESIVHSFRGGSGGSRPLGALILDRKGNLYGTASSGGADCNGFGVGCGTVFRLTPDGNYRVLHAFAGGSDGIYPAAGLSLGADGNFYGTTANGGIDCDDTGQGCGIVFKLTPDGAETVLYAFPGGDHGAYPAGGVIRDDAGNLFGTTNNGGVDCDFSGGCGVAFKLATDGTETTLHVFAGGNDGAHPRSAPLMDAAGNLYDTTVEGGGENDGGIVFRLSPTGKEKILYAFQGGDDGGGPFSGLTADALGNLYGTTFTGGSGFNGTVFRLGHR
jgi:uncharacterized repeat protein (TIGR03803 family)